MKNKPQEEWEKEFEILFGYASKNDIKEFISSLLQSEYQRGKLDGMKELEEKIKSAPLDIYVKQELERLWVTDRLYSIVRETNIATVASVISAIDEIVDSYKK